MYADDSDRQRKRDDHDREWKRGEYDRRGRYDDDEEKDVPSQEEDIVQKFRCDNRGSQYRENRKQGRWDGL